MSIGPSMPLRLEKPERIDLAQAARYFGARGGADAATPALLEKWQENYRHCQTHKIV